MWYRIYQVDSLGHVRGASDVECESDADAIAFGQAAVGRQGIEVWQGARQVAVLPAAPATSAERPLSQPLSPAAEALDDD